MAAQIPQRCFLLFFLFLITAHCLAQKFKVRAHAYSGLFFFRGTGAVYTTKTTFDDMGYFNAYPYGRKSAFSYAVEPQIQRVSKNKFIYGMGLGYENLKSKEKVDSVYTDFGIRPVVKGEVILVNKFITLNPFIGRRFNFKKISIDALAGVDFAFNTKVVENIHNPYGRRSFSKKQYPLDKRPRIQLQVNYERFGLSIGYSRGTKNLFHSGWSYLNREVRTDFLRMGVSYKLVSF